MCMLGQCHSTEMWSSKELLQTAASAARAAAPICERPHRERLAGSDSQADKGMIFKAVLCLV